MLKQNDDGTVVPQPSSTALGCGAANSGNYAWLATTSFAPSYNPFRSGQIRRHHAFSLDTSMLKMTQITERVRVQLGFEAFNVANHNFYGLVSNFDTSPTSTTFGVIRPSTVPRRTSAPPDSGPLQVLLVGRIAIPCKSKGGPATGRLFLLVYFTPGPLLLVFLHRDNLVRIHAGEPCIAPLGQRISSESTFAFAPSPKCWRKGLVEPKPSLPLTSR